MLTTVFAPLLKYFVGGLAFVCIILGIALHLERVHSHKVEAQLAKANAELVRITTARNEQKVETTERVEEAHQKQRTADDKARVIEQSPLPGQCRSPSEIMRADL